MPPIQGPLDVVRLQEASRRLCATFGVPSAHSFQEETGRYVLEGRSVILDVPTGAGKTLAFYYALFYYWEPGNNDEECQKIILTVSPLIALMQAQVRPF